MNSPKWLVVIAVLELFGNTLYSGHAHAQALEPKKANVAAKPWLGIAIDQGSKGVLVKGVLPDTPAEKAGFQVGDEVLKIDKSVVKNPNELINVIGASGIGQTVTIEILRNKKTITKKLKLVLRPDELQLLRDRLVAKPAPSFDLEVIHGKETGSLEKLKGRIVVVEFWATWCPACRATHPRLSEFAAQNPKIAVLAVSEEEKDVLQSYANRLKPNFTILRDADGKSPAAWSAGSIPMLSVIGKDGKVMFVTVGAGDAAEEALKFAASMTK
jgi:thiol-disulfide isomerase/thioredoxin